MTSTKVWITNLGVGYTIEIKHQRTRACSLFTIPIMFSGLFTCVCVCACVCVCVCVCVHVKSLQSYPTL